MFGQYAPVTWYLTYDWQKLNRSHKLHTPLSRSPAISKKKGGLSPKVKTSTPQGCPLFLWPTFLIFRRPRAPPCWVIKLLQWQDEKVEPLGARTPVPSGYPNPTRYPVFLSIPDPTRLSFKNHRVAGNPKHQVLPDISGKPEVSGTTRYFGYHL